VSALAGPRRPDLLPAGRRRRGATVALADAIETVMRAHPDGIPSAEHWIALL